MLLRETFCMITQSCFVTCTLFSHFKCSSALKYIHVEYTFLKYNTVFLRNIEKGNGNIFIELA